MSVNPYVWFLYTHAGTLPPPQPRQTDYWAGWGIREGAITARLPHGLGTADVVPAFTPSWNTDVWPTLITDTFVDVKFSVPAVPRFATLDFSISRGTPQAVTAGLSTVAVSHNLGAGAVLLFAANWNTTINLVSKSESTAIVSFGVEAPVGAYLYYGAHADDSDITSTETVSSGASTHVFTHSASRAFLPTFVTPYWNTRVTCQDRSDLNYTVLKFSTPAPSATSLDARVKAVGNMVVS